MTGRSKRILIGCGIGCGSVILLAIVAAVAFGMWVGGKGELLEPQRLLGAETTGYAEWTLRLEDPGTDGFMQLLIDALEAERAGQGERMLDWVRQLILRNRNRDAAEQIRELFPVVVAWTMAPSDEPGKDQMLFTISPTGLGNRLVLADWAFGFAARWGDDGLVEHYRDEKIYQMPGGSSGRQILFQRAGTVFLTTDMDSAKVAVDRLQEADPAQRRSGPLDPLFAETSAQRSVRGAISNHRGEVPRLWREIAGNADRELMEALRSVTLDGGLQEDGSLLLELHFRGPDRDWAEARAEELRAAVERALDESELELLFDARTADDIVHVEVRVVDIVGALERVLAEQERRSGVRINL